MPYSMQHRDSKVVVVNKQTGEVKGTFDNAHAAAEFMRALYANEPDARQQMGSTKADGARTRRGTS